MGMEFKSLADTSVYKRLQAAATKPFDLTKEHALEADGRLGRYVCRSSLLNYHYGTQRLDDDVLDLLQTVADELDLVGQFKAMREGGVLNRIEGYESEERQVLHTACRDLFVDTPAEPKATAAAQRELEKLESFLIKVGSGELTNRAGEPFDTVVHVGIGGSDLGPRAIYESLRAYGLSGRKVYFVSNVDPDDVAAVLREVNIATTLVAIVSKSGTTLETLTNEKLVAKALENQGLQPKDHCVAITGQGSPMDDPTQYLKTFYMFDYIGGRYSSSSMVGAFVLSFYLGFDTFKEFLQGASTVDRLAEVRDIRDNIPLLMALIGVWNHNFLDCSTVAVLPYSQALNRFPAHLQQCDMESNGKSITRYGAQVDIKTGPLVWGEPGTNGQHAFYQLLHQGTEIVPVEFIGFKQSQYGDDLVVEGSSSQEKLLANLYAQVVAMAVGQRSDNPNKNFPGNRPSSLLIADRLTPEVMGAILAAYEAKIVFQGFTWNINSFDQEGVQLGKVLAGRFLSAMEEGSGGDASFENIFLDQL